MYIGKITGNVLSTIKIDKLRGYKLLMVEIWENYPNQSEKKLHIAIDLVGAGIGDTVMVMSGSQINHAVDKGGMATDTAIIGIIDKISPKSSDA